MSFVITSSSYLDSTADKSGLLKKEVLVPQVAFIGRSNAGKSTLLNGLCNRKALAKVGSTPGRTQLINYFEVLYQDDQKNNFISYFSDLPGYGFAKVSPQMRKKWNELIFTYLTQFEPAICRLILIVDMRRKFTDEEKWFFEIFPKHKITLVLSKEDKLKSNDKKKQKSYFKKELAKINEHDLVDNHVSLFTSSLIGKNKSNLDLLRNHILQFSSTY